MSNTDDKILEPLPEEYKKAVRKPRWFVLKASYSSLPYREKLLNAGFKIFLPTYFEMQKVANRKVRVEKPSVMNYIFVYAKSDELYEFTKFLSGLSIIYKPRPLHDPSASDVDDWLLSVPDRQMEFFMRNIVNYDKEVPFFKPNEVELEKGDYVRIVGGPFEGAEGVLKTSQGKEGGKVLVSIGNILMIQTLEIEPKYIQVLSFAKKGKHLYKNFDSFIAKGRKALDHFYNPEDVSMSAKIKDNAAMHQFITRFSQLQTPTVNARLKLQVNLLICYTCLAEDEQQQQMIADIKETLLGVNSDIFRAFALAIIYRCTQDEKYLQLAKAVTSAWGTPKAREKQKIDILKDMGLMKDKVKHKNK